MIAADVTVILTNGGNPSPWIQEAALLAYPSKFGQFYTTTAVKFYTEVTVRVPARKRAKRSGQEYDGLQRRRIDLVALIQPNKFKYIPIVAGVEVKVDEHDLHNDVKLIDYLPYCDLFYLACPEDLRDAAYHKRHAVGFTWMGLLLVEGSKVVEHVHPHLNNPTDTHLKEIYAELLIKEFRESLKPES